FFSSVLLPPPTSTLFPYTTLFRSVYAFRINEVSKLTLDDIDWEAERLHVRRSKLKKVEEYPLATEVGTAILRYLKEVRPRSSRRDRKSTRLNSSHVSISYAVFCLK